MNKMFHIGKGGFRPNNVMLYAERSEEQEFGKARKDTGVCAWCAAVYKSKAWHHASDARGGAARHPGRTWLGRCPACEMIANGLYEGKVTIRNIPPEKTGELAGLIRSTAARAFARDCQHRLIALHRESDDEWIVTVTENQLANRLARRIKNTFKHVDLKISYSHEPDDVERVEVSFRPSPLQRLLTAFHEQLAYTAWNGKGVMV